MFDSFAKIRKCVLFIPLSSLGHINASLGIALALKVNGHRIVFATEKTWQNKFARLGFEEELYEEREVQENEEPGKYWSETIKPLFEVTRKPPKEQMKFIETSYREFVDSVMYSDSRIAEIINHVNPDVIVQDNYVCYPSIAKSGKPSVLLFSANPLALFSNSELPPPYFGLPLNDSTEWEQCDKILKETLLKSWQNFNKWVIEKGAPSLPPFKFQYISKHLNVYVYPKSLVEDYARFANLGPEFIGLDHTITTTPQKFEIPASLKALPGKLILFSLGSMASSDIELTKRLVAIMSKSKHRFIVSKGQDSDKYELPSNMWGEPRIPQMDILPLVDLFITHGGNNSFVESLYCGKPMIILPIFMDQHDNAQRAVEMKIGIKLNPFTVEEHVLLEAIDKLVNDASVAERINKISELMRKSSSMDLVIERIERIAQTSQIPSI